MAVKKFQNMLLENQHTVMAVSFEKKYPGVVQPDEEPYNLENTKKALAEAG